MAWLSGWDYRVKLTTDSGDITSALSNFPILLYISASSGRNNDDISFVFDELGSDANRKKIAVTESDGTTECKVEIEKWDDANEKAWLWVKAPSISSGADTDFYLYYDSSHADNDANVGDVGSTPGQAVWDANFQGVWHLSESGEPATVYDSTSNGRNGTKVGNPQACDGIRDGGIDFDGNGDSYNTGNASYMDDWAGVTVEGWFFRTSSGDERIICKTASTSSSDHVVSLQVYGDARLRIRMVTDGSGGDKTGSFDDTDGAPQNEWVYGAFTWDAASETVTIYSNGAYGASKARDGDTLFDQSEDLIIGNAKDGIDRYFTGKIDEVRISNILRTAAWIKATYETGIDDLLDWGSEETSGPTTGWNQLAYTSEPPTANAWNQLKRDAGSGWKKLNYG